LVTVWVIVQDQQVEVLPERGLAFEERARRSRCRRWGTVAAGFAGVEWNRVCRKEEEEEQEEQLANDAGLSTMPLTADVSRGSR